MVFKTQAFYFDGHTSVPHNVELTLDSETKNLSFAKFEDLVSVSLNDTEYEIYNNKMEIRLKNEDMPIVIEDNAFISETKHLFKTGIYQKLVGMKFRTHLLLAPVVLLLIIAIYISATPFIAKKAVPLIPIAVDVKLGELFMEKYIDSTKIDSAKTFLLNEFAGKFSWDSNVELKFHVIKSGIVNAFALPSGDVIVFTGLLDKIKDYESLSALLGHEISHVNKRHSMQIICKSLAGYALISVLTSDISGLMAIIMENAGRLNDLSYSRDMELEADNAGIALLEKNKINPAGMFKLMNILQTSVSDYDAEFLSTHPVMEKRIKNAESKINEKDFPKNPELEELFKALLMFNKGF
ncbi:MAG: M48 family metallopeptidase [Fibromonadales bacterium]|nr:M48 family metallopeptidase [Fibromonadales bacterium]